MSALPPTQATTCVHCDTPNEPTSESLVQPVNRECTSCGKSSGDHVQPQEPTKSLPVPPFLLIDILSSILAYLTLDYPSLLSATLVSKTWNTCTIPILYREIWGPWDSRMKGLIHTLDATRIDSRSSGPSTSSPQSRGRDRGHTVSVC